MKILMINKFLHPNGGSETYMFSLGECLQARGHEVQYFGMEHEGRIVGNRVNAYTSNMDFHGGSLPKKLTYSVKTVYSAEARKKLRLVLEDYQPDVCHLNNFNYQLTPSILLEIQKWKRQTGHSCKVIYTAHDYQLVCPNHMCYNANTQTNCEKCLRGSFLHCIRGKCIHGSRLKSAVGAVEAIFWKRIGVYRHIDAILCCSRFVKAKLDTNPMLASKTVALHNYVNHPAGKGWQKKPYVLYFGRFSQEKGIMTLIEACKGLSDIPFVFAGSGPLEAELQGIANITNAGFCQGEKLDALIGEARFAVCPSVWYEPFGLTVAEAIAHGTPVIGADIGGISEQIHPGETGELFTSGEVGELAEKIRYLWDTPATVQTYSENCRQASCRTVDVYYQELMRIYCGDAACKGAGE